MPPSLLSRDGVEALTTFLAGEVLIAFDFDGVLAPIVQARDQAHIRKRTRTLLVRVAESFPCVVVSGRGLADLQPRLEGIPLKMVFGNFGYEPPAAGDVPPAKVADWVVDLERRFAREQGIVVENKHFSVAVHYRHSPNPARAVEMVEHELKQMQGGRVIEGTMAVMLVPDDGPTKGSTLQQVQRRLGCARAVYVGDDATDEDAFGSAPPARLLSVKVGAAESTQAMFMIERQSEIDRVLALMLRTRRPPTSSARAQALDG